MLCDSLRNFVYCTSSDRQYNKSCRPTALCEYACALKGAI